MRRKSLFLSLCVVLVALSSLTRVEAKTYNYSYYAEAIASAPAMIVKQVVTSAELCFQFQEKTYDLLLVNPIDVFVFDDHIYVLDNELNQIMILNDQFEVTRVYPHPAEDHPQHHDILSPELRLNRPRGLHVTADSILIADTNNGRLVLFDHDFNLLDTFGRPDDTVFDDLNIDYRPQKVTRDNTGRIYVVAQGIFEGIIELDIDGSFGRYMGVNRVAVNPLDIFWMRFMTEAQRDQLRLQLPPSFVNLYMDPNNFIFAVANPSSTYTGDNMIQRINPRGNNVLRTSGYFPPKGDYDFVHGAEVVPSGPSSLIDITVNQFGLYSALDQRRGRIFTYDAEGNLLYITGEIGSQRGMFSQPRALDYFNDDLIIVDSGNRSIIVFEMTEFGSLVNEATQLHQQSRYDEAADVWNEVLRHNTNYFLAYRGIGRTALRNGDYEAAMGYFTRANDMANYSIAYQHYRNERLETFFPLIMLGVTAGIAYLFYSSIKTNIRLNKDVGTNEE